MSKLSSPHGRRRGDEPMSSRGTQSNQRRLASQSLSVPVSLSDRRHPLFPICLYTCVSVPASAHTVASVRSREGDSNTAQSLARAASRPDRQPESAPKLFVRMTCGGCGKASSGGRVKLGTPLLVRVHACVQLEVPFFCEDCQPAHIG